MHYFQLQNTTLSQSKILLTSMDVDLYEAWNLFSVLCFSKNV